QTLVGLGKVVSGQIDATKAVQGPISIAKNIYGGVWNWQNFWQMTGLLSLVIGIINILPIPALDGGHVMFLIYEAIRGKPVPDNAMKVIQTIGVVLLMSLMVFVIFNDIWRAFMK
ncbi:MAG: RIP metalloprotease RseP, partial [Bacteroidetes bacterium SW_10_40_5]